MEDLLASLPDCFYRVAVRCVIRGADDTVLLVKEDGSAWALPGGGVSNGESVEAALRRELSEEVVAHNVLRASFLGADSFFNEHRNAWAFWLVYEIELEDIEDARRGDDVDAAAFIKLEVLASSPSRAEKMAYKWAKVAVERSNQGALSGV